MTLDLGCHSAKSPGCLELFFQLSFEPPDFPLALTLESVVLDLAYSHADQPPAWSSQERSVLSGLSPDGPLS